MKGSLCLGVFLQAGSFLCNFYTFTYSSIALSHDKCHILTGAFHEDLFIIVAP